MTAKDRQGTPIQAGDVCTYRPDLDDMEATFGVVPISYNGDPCTVKAVSSPTVVLVTFEDDPSAYRVHSASLVKQRRLEPPAPPAAPSPTTKPAEQ